MLIKRYARHNARGPMLCRPMPSLFFVLIFKFLLSVLKGELRVRGWYNFYEDIPVVVWFYISVFPSNIAGEGGVSVGIEKQDCCSLYSIWPLGLP